MNFAVYEHLALLRAVVGYLGEKAQYGWWQSSFLAQSSPSFLTPIFPRTRYLAQCQGVTQAAARVHDERIGVGRVYHLFRLPEDVEQGIYQALHDADLCGRIDWGTMAVEAALTLLRGHSAAVKENCIGPAHIGDIHSLRQPGPWDRVAALYLRAFEDGYQSYPYFKDGV